MTERKRMEQNGLYVSEPDHWEMWEKTVHVYHYSYKQKYKTKSGEERKCLCHQSVVHFNVPVDIVKHLKLKTGDEILVAIKRKK